MDIQRYMVFYKVPCTLQFLPLLLSNSVFTLYFYRDRFATPVNIWSNCTACVIIEHYSRKELQSFDDVTKPCDEVRISEASETNTIVNIGIANEVEVTIETNDNKEDITLRNLNT